MFPKDPIELFKTAARSTLGRCYLFLATGGIATTLGGLCASLEPGHIRYLNPFSEGEPLFITAILLPVAWLGGFFFSLGHLFGVMNSGATILIAVKLLHRRARKRLCLLPLLTVQTIAVFLASDGNHWIAWTPAIPLCLGFSGLFLVAWAWPHLRPSRWSLPDHPRAHSSRIQPPPTASNRLQPHPTASNRIQPHPTASSRIQPPPTASTSPPIDEINHPVRH